MATLDSSNPEAITYQTEELGFTILGGIRLDGLDRMRVTLKIEVINRQFGHYLNNPEIAGLALRHNLDLYNDVQVEKLIRKTSERLEVGIIQLSKALADITAQLERYRLEQVEQQARYKVDKVKTLTPEETEAAIRFLQEPGLMERTGELIGESGVIGEIHNRLLMYLIFTSRKTLNPLHIISFGSSGAGKSHLQEKVAELIPTEDKIESTSLTSNALYYFGEYDLEHKLILIEDLDGAEPVLYALRELISKKHITKLVPLKDSKGVTRTLSFTVKGPVTVAGCTTQESVYEDNANRSFLVYIDESKAQDEAVMDYQRKKSAGVIHSEEQNRIKALLQNTQRLLQPVSVRNPYAEQLKLPPQVFKPRRTNAHYLAFIEAVTFYHQYQREPKADTSTGEMFIETTITDIEEANKLMKTVLLRKADSLSGAARNYLEQLKEYLQQVETVRFSNRDIRQALRLPGTTVRRYHSELQQGGYIKLIEGKKQKGYEYEIISYEEYTHLQHSINNVLDDIVRQLRTSALVVSHPVGGSLKPRTAKALKVINQ
jgi:ABC-type dipeptide/oligopeptide/nickel transport system ATPase component